jgi:hypothetical protein
MVDITVVSWSRLGKLSVTELVKEFHAFCAVQKFIAEFTKAHHGPCCETAVSSPHSSGRIFDAIRCYCDECTVLGCGV